MYAGTSMLALCNIIIVYAYPYSMPIARLVYSIVPVTTGKSYEYAYV